MAKKSKKKSATVRRRRRTSAPLVRRANTTQEIILREAPAPVVPRSQHYLSRARGYFHGRTQGLTSMPRMKRGASLAVGGAAGNLLNETFGMLMQPSDAQLLVGAFGYVLGGTPDFMGGIGDGMLANAGGDWIYGKFKSWLARSPAAPRPATPTGVTGTPTP